MAWLTAVETVSSTVLTATDRLSAQLSMQERQVGHAAGSRQPAAERACTEGTPHWWARPSGQPFLPPERRPATVMWRPERALARPSSMSGLVRRQRRAMPRERRQRRSSRCVVTAGRQLESMYVMGTLRGPFRCQLCDRFAAAEGLVCGSARPGGWACQQGDHRGSRS